jgi:RHS repeat-associated protein
MRKYTIPQSMTVEYLLGDHLGSTSITTNANGAKVSELRYKAWGEIRYSWTSNPATTPAYKLPNYTFTGQYSYMDDPTTAAVTEGFGLMFYNARWYDPSLGRFAQPDTIVPSGAQGLDRYAYVNNAPTRFTDPSGHRCEDGDGACFNEPPTTIIVVVNLATSIAQNTFASQLFHANISSIPTGHGNLCGDIALEMIYETVTGEIDALGKIYSASTRTDKGRYGGQNVYQLGQQFAGSFPSGWSATAYYNNYVYNFQAGNQWHLPSSPGAVDRSLTEYSMEEIQSMVTNMLSQGHYVVAGVSLSTKTGFLAPNGIGHFVVITGSNSKYVYICSFAKIMR